MPYAKETIEFNHCFSFLHVHSDLCKHLGKDLSTNREGLSFFSLFLVNYQLLSDRILIWGTFLSFYPCTSHPLVS